MKRIAAVLFFCAILFLSLIPFSSVQACTIWAATGELVKDKGSIIAKNRDNLSNLYTTPKVVFPEKGFPFYGLFDIEADGYVTAGINEKGLVVVNAAANSVPRKKRHTATEDLTQRLLISYGSVDAVLSDKALFEQSHPAIYIIGDASKIASIEVAPGGKTSSTVKEKGTLAFTNHYTNEELAYANEQSSVSSLMRLKQIQHLLTSQATPFILDDFIVLSRDTNGGQEGALWRSSGGPDSIRTLASWIVYVPSEGAPSLYVKLANPNEPERAYTIILDSAFWKEKRTPIRDHAVPSRFLLD